MEKDNTLEIRINKFSLGNKAIFIFLVKYFSNFNSNAYQLQSP